MLKRTPFYDFHLAAGAKLVDFAGWEMPILYRGIVEEHEQTRRSGSVFDVSHMGRLYFTGRDAARFLDHVVTRNVSEQKVGQSRYSLVCNELGGVMDDVIVSRDERHWLLVCNASNREKLVRYFQAVRQEKNFDVQLDDRTESTAMAAVQGPKVIDKLSEVLPTDLKGMKRYTFQSDEVMMTRYTVFRSGYTGEEGVELVLPAKAAALAMRLLGDARDHEAATVRPAGLGARDTLRLEAGMPLYGHELSETIDPLSAGLAWAVDLGGKDFVGAEALREKMAKGLRRRLVGLELEGRRIARQGTPVKDANGSRVVGEVTSGTFSPTLQKSIAMAFLDSGLGEGATVQVDLKGTLNPARVVKLPFYKRAS